MMRRFAVPAVAVGLVLSTTALPAAGQVAGFNDVPRGNTHADAITRGTERDVIEGKTSTRFDPAGSLTRAQTASLIARALDQAGVELPAVAGTPSFSDTGAPHADNVRRLAAAGIVQGKTDGRFDPQTAVTRDQLASLYVRAYLFAIGDLPLDIELGTFGDVPEDSVHALAIDTAAALGLMQGKTDGRFAPRDATRRDQAASVVVRFLDTVEGILDAPFELTVLHSNDGESALLPNDDDPGVARFIADLQLAQLGASVDAGDTVRRQVTVFSGDAFLAGPELNASTSGDTFFDALVYLAGGYDAMTVGNHEFDFGPDLLADFIEASTPLQFVSANLDVAGEPRLAAFEDEGRLAASTTIRRAGRDIAVVGATTEDLPTLTSPGNVVATDVADAVIAEVAAVRAAGAEIVILSSHLQDINNELALAAELSGVDAIVGGGGGEDIRDTYPLVAEDADGDDVPVVTVPGNYRDVGRLVLEVATDGDITVGDGSALELVELDGPRNELMAEAVEAPVAAFVADLAETVVASTEVPLDGRRESVRARETNLGDLLADGMLASARSRAASFGVPEADVAIQNGGGVRNESVLPVGDITALTTFNVAPFGNFLAVDTIDGELLRDVIEHGLAGLPGPAGQFAQWAGVDFRYDEDLAAGSRITTATVTRADGSTYELVTDGVTNPTAADEDFTIAGLNFTLNGGDGFPFDATFTTLGITDQQVFADHLASLGTVTASQYPNLTDGADLYNRFGPVDGTFVD